MSATTEFLVQSFVIVTKTRVYVGIVIVQEEILKRNVYVIDKK